MSALPVSLPSPHQLLGLASLMQQPISLEPNGTLTRIIVGPGLQMPHATGKANYIGEVIPACGAGLKLPVSFKAVSLGGMCDKSHFSRCCCCSVRESLGVWGGFTYRLACVSSAFDLWGICMGSNCRPWAKYLRKYCSFNQIP